MFLFICTYVRVYEIKKPTFAERLCRGKILGRKWTRAGCSTPLQASKWQARGPFPNIYQPRWVCDACGRVVGGKTKVFQSCLKFGHHFGHPNVRRETTLLTFISRGGYKMSADVVALAKTDVCDFARCKLDANIHLIVLWASR